MPKKGKEKKPSAPPVDLATATEEEERQLEVFLHWDTAVCEVPGVLIVVRLNHQEHFVQPRQLLEDSHVEGAADVHQQPLSPVAPASPFLSLVKQGVRVGGPSERHTLLNDTGAHRIDVYSLPGLGDADESTGVRPLRAAAAKRKKTGIPSAKSKGKSAAGLSSLPEGTCLVGHAVVSLVALLSRASMDVVVPLTPGTLPSGSDLLRFRVQSHDGTLFTPQCMAECRPVLVRVYNVEGFASSASPSVESPGKGASPAVKSRRRLRVCVTLAGGRVMTAVEPAPPHSADSPSASASPPAMAETPFHDHVLFMNELGTPLEVYRKVYCTPCEVTFWQSFEMDTEGAVGNVRQEGSDTLLGSGHFSFRDLLMDQQTQFSESVQLLPGRSTVDSAKGETCLTSGCSITVHLNFFLPFTSLQHVDKDGQPLPRKSFLTRAIVRLPYTAPWMMECLALLLREVTALPRATQDVELYLPPPPTPPPGEAADQEKPGGAHVGSHTNRIPRPASFVAAKRSVSNVQKPDRKGVAPAPSDLKPPTPTPSFADPIKIYSPPGISGFEVADGEMRLWCLEGTVPEMQRALVPLGTFAESRRGGPLPVQIVFNAELAVLQRSYIHFPPLVVPPTTQGINVPPVGDLKGSSSALEVEPSGTGGRLHRIRLRSTVADLCQTQSHYIRHTLSDDCLQCLHSLAALKSVTSMWEAEMRGWMPSATSLIATERSFGQTLEKEDLYGAPMCASASLSLSAPHSVEAAPGVPDEGSTVDDTSDAISSEQVPLMTSALVGSLVFFDGVLKPGARRHLPEVVRQRFPVCAWMVVKDTKEEIFCAFPHNVPTSLVQYHVEGQVVQCASVTLLYVLKCVCLARSVTKSHNAAFELVLRERRREQNALLQKKTVPLSSTYPASASATVATLDVGSDRANTRGQGALNEAAQRGGGEVGSSDEEDDQEWLGADMDRYLYMNPAAPRVTQAAPQSRQLNAASSRRRPQRSHQQRLVPGASSSRTDLTYQELWRLYERRDPASAEGNTSQLCDKLPPIRF